jgi:hypothetical protein
MRVVGVNFMTWLRLHNTGGRWQLEIVWWNKNYQKKKNENTSSSTSHYISPRQTFTTVEALAVTSASIRSCSRMTSSRQPESGLSARVKRKKGKRFLEQKVSLFQFFFHPDLKRAHEKDNLTLAAAIGGLQEEKTLSKVVKHQQTQVCNHPRPEVDRL